MNDYSSAQQQQQKKVQALLLLHHPTQIMNHPIFAQLTSNQRCSSLGLKPAAFFFWILLDSAIILIMVLDNLHNSLGDLNINQSNDDVVCRLEDHELLILLDLTNEFWQKVPESTQNSLITFFFFSRSKKVSSSSTEPKIGFLTSFGNF